MNIEKYNEKMFEDIKHIDESGNEYWEARELMLLLEYSKWENFNNVIRKAVIAYRNSNNDNSYWLPEVRKPIITGKGKEEFIVDYKLSRYICYLIVQNANPKKKMVALGQTYFAIQTRKMELTEEEYSNLTEDEKRLYRRNQARKGNYNLNKTAVKSGVKDLAKLYQCANGTKDINKAVKRNLDRFPEDFYFQLTENKYKNLRFQFGTSSLKEYGGRRYNPYVFTEQGVAMLATVLKTNVAAEASIRIMRAFVAMRTYILSNVPEQKYITSLVLKHDEQLTKHEKVINDIFDFFERKNPKNDLYSSGQVYAAYSKILDIFSLAKEELIIIDSYADKYVLDMISKVNVLVTIVLSTKSRLSELDINKYNQEYNNLNLIYNDTFHDRFIILDNKILYNLGTSINNAGTKTFIINKIEDKNILLLLLNKIQKNELT